MKNPEKYSYSNLKWLLVLGEDVCFCGFKGKTKSVTHMNDITAPPKTT